MPTNGRGGINWLARILCNFVSKYKDEINYTIEDGPEGYKIIAFMIPENKAKPLAQFLDGCLGGEE